ncbi:MAG TPA: glycosyltransferase [Jiangellales bacterium]|nr:glycosyltransferase [Jiangellales bacterium]
MRTSVIVPAFNEEAGIHRLLLQLTRSSDFGPDLEIIVAANGCTDKTAEIARSYGVAVIDLPAPSKTAALNAADELATGDVRIYLDADVPIAAGLLRQLAAAVAEPGVEAAVPRPLIDASASSWPVRAYYAVNSRLPVFSRRLFGRGVIAISASARGRFDAFPEITADDMFLDAIVAADEKAEIDVPVRVIAPRRARHLIQRLARARDGNDEFWRFVRSAPPAYGLAVDPVPGPSAWSWLRDGVLRAAPRLLPAAVVYVSITLLAEAKRRSPGWNVRSGWGRPASATVPARTVSTKERVPEPRRAPAGQVDVDNRISL